MQPLGTRLGQESEIPSILRNNSDDFALRGSMSVAEGAQFRARESWREVETLRDRM